MIGYVTLGTNDFEESSQFYDSLLTLCGAKRLMEFDGFILWGTSPDKAGLALAKPFDEKPASVGNGFMAAIHATSKDMVNELHGKALELGGENEGDPGPRGDGFYAGYFRDPQGNKLNVFYFGK